MPATNFQDTFLMIWVGTWSGWFIWVAAKIYKFESNSVRQAAISKPQLSDLSKELLKSTVIANFLTIASFALSQILIPGGQINDFQIIKTFLLCLIVPLTLVFSLLMLRVMFIKIGLKLPLTDKREVSIPEPPKPPPYADKSFERLSKELDDSLKRLKGE